MSMGILVSCPVCGGNQLEVLAVVGLIAALYAWRYRTMQPISHSRVAAVDSDAPK